MFIFRSPSPHGYDGIMSDSESQSLGFKFNFQFRRVKPELAANKLNSSSIPLSSRESCAAAAHELVPRPLTNLNLQSSNRDRDFERCHSVTVECMCSSSSCPESESIREISVLYW